MKRNHLDKWRIKWDKRHDNDPYCEQCLNSVPLEKLTDLDDYKFCDTCLPEAQKEFAAFNQWVKEQS